MEFYSEENVCSTCYKVFSRKDALARHEKTHSNEKSFLCEICGKMFQRKDEFQRHLKSHSLEKVIHLCEICQEEFASKTSLMQHKRSIHTPAENSKRKITSTNTSNKRFKPNGDALNMFKTLMFYPEENEKNDLQIFHNRLSTELIECLRQEIQEKGAIKWYLVEKLCLIRILPEAQEEERIETYFRSCCRTEFTEDNLDLHLKEGFAKIIKSFEDFLQNGSGWKLEKIVHLELNAAKYYPLAASSYIPLPKKLAAKKAVLNIQNEDQKCLTWCLLAHKLNIHWKDHPERVYHYTSYESDIKTGNVEYPIPVNKIPIIEKLNNLRINVFGYENEEICPLYISPLEDENCINLLLITNENQQHYCLIRNFSRLLGNLTSHKTASFYCYRCLHRFSREDLLKDHLTYCKEHAAQVIKLPTTDNILKFTGLHLQHPVGYVIYADFESLIVPITSVTPSSQTSYIEKIASHVPCGYAYVIIGPDGHSVKPVSVYRGENAVEHFLDSILKEKEELELKLKEIKPMHLTEDEEKSFQEAKNCNLCKKPLDSNRVRDHCHLTGQYRGALHAKCNINFKQPKTIPVIFHNLKNYDGHHIMTKLGKYKDYDLQVIAQTMEKYITFRLMKRGCPVQLVFLDSFQFLPASLDKLVKNLDFSQFKILKENFPSETPLNLLTRKGVYCYDYISSHEKFNEEKLPPPSAFYNSLTEEFISNEDYEHAQNVWKLFKMRNLGDYHDLYVKTDVLLLADIFQNFRKLCLQYYEIDSAHLFTSPGLAWQACLKMSDISLELFTDPNMLLLIEKGIRGGISMISRRYAKANNPYLSNYDAKEASSYIMYWDANNLYGYAMSQFLPYGQFEWYPVDNISEAWIHTLQDDSPEGYIFEVDLEYPEHLHNLHNDYPVAPERMTVEETMLSPFAKNMLKNEQFVGTPKLIPNLNDKKHYVVHYRNLKLYLQLGLKLTHVHKALKFKQAPWLKKYILFNTEKRKQATTSFEKDFFKLLNNSVFGKTMENLRKRRNIELCNNQKRGQKLVAASTFKGFKTFNEDLVAVERLKASILMNRPVYVGFTILELSKLLMYEFHYNFIKKMYNSQAKLLFTDTDSLTYHITTPDIYKDMQQYTSAFDFSDYPKDHPLYSEENKKVIGKFKDELNGKPIQEFVGLKAKMYSILSATCEKKTAKGVSTQVVRKKISHENYVDCLKNLSTSIEKQMRIGQDSHNIYSLKQNKVSLNPFDDKRYILDDGISSYAYGHCKISEN